METERLTHVAVTPPHACRVALATVFPSDSSTLLWHLNLLKRNGGVLIYRNRCVFSHALTSFAGRKEEERALLSVLHVIAIGATRTPTLYRQS